MGIVFKQSFRNTIIIYLSFVVGALNNIIFYPTYLKGEYHGIITLLFSYSNIIMPIMAFGVQYTIVKFFSSYKDDSQRDRLMSWALIFPLFIAIPFAIFWNHIHDLIVSYLTPENQKLENYTITIYIIAISCAYFEVFYSWAKVQMKTVFGNVLKEFWFRFSIFICLILVYLEYITKSQFIYIVTINYVLRTLVMMIYSFRLYFPKFQFSLPYNYKELLKYSAFIILAGSAGAIIIDIDKLMIPGKQAIATAAYYAVAVFIGSFIEAPARAMSQILQPLTSKSLNENNNSEVANLYQKSSINLFLIGGLFFLLVNCNVSELFKLMPKAYAGGELVVLMISSVKLYTMTLGNNISIIQNSKFYRISLPIGLGSAFGVYFLNKYFYLDLNIGTEGLALSTLLIISFFNAFKIWFVYKKFKMQPYTLNTLKMFFSICLLFGAFYFWNFPTPELFLGSIPLHPIINICLKSLLIVSVYIYIILKLNISEQFTNLLMRLKSRF